MPAPVSIVTETSAGLSSDDDDDEQPRKNESEKQQVSGSKRNSNTKFPYGAPLPSPLGSAHSFDVQVRIELFIKIIEIKIIFSLISH